MQSYYIKQRLPKYQPSAAVMWGITAAVAGLFLVQVRTHPLLNLRMQPLSTLVTRFGSDSLWTGVHGIFVRRALHDAMTAAAS